jgi:predicted DsbA family dithiol-disulfide isomerase
LVSLAAEEFPEWNLDDLREYLDCNEGATVVKQDIQSGQQRFGIKGVPFFVVSRDDGSSNQKPYVFSGAQTSETFCEIFRDLSERK